MKLKGSPNQVSTISGVVIILVAVAIGPVSCSVKTYDNAEDRQYTKLVEELKYPPIEGAWEGFATGITTNAATEAVCAKGPEIIPTLIAALDHSSWKQTVWIVVCLTEMRATAAKSRILELKSEYEHGRFAKEPHDLTLDLQIQFYSDCVDGRPLSAGQKSGSTGMMLICFRYAGDVSDKPFFPLVIAQQGMPEQEATRLAGLQNSFLPAIYFYLSSNDIEDTVAAIGPVAMCSDVATNAEYGDFSVIILGSGPDFIKTIGRKDMCRLLQRMPSQVLKNNKDLNDEVNEMKERLSVK